MDYLARCSFLLRQGIFAADVAWYYGDKAPNFFPEYQEDPDSPEVPGLSAGYDFDVINTDVLLNHMDVSDGKLVLPDGLAYKLLVLPDRPDIPPTVIARVEDLVKAGIIDPAKVTRSALQNAASIASLVLTTECIIADHPEKSVPAAPGGMPDMGGGMPGMGGMGGMPGMM